MPHSMSLNIMVQNLGFVLESQLFATVYLSAALASAFHLFLCLKPCRETYIIVLFII